MVEIIVPLAKAFGRLQQATAWVAQNGLKNADEAGAAASDYLRLFAMVAMGFMWARMMKVALANQDGEKAAFYKAKLATGRFFMSRLLPQTSGLFSAIMAGGETIMAPEEEWF